MKIKLCTSILIFPLAFFFGCAPTIDEAKFKQHFNHLHGYDICGDISNMECLKTIGWKIEKTSIENIEKSIGKNTLASWLQQWDSFKAKYQDGDEVWYFLTPPATWQALMGTEGYVILRDKKRIAEIWIAIN